MSGKEVILPQLLVELGRRCSLGVFGNATLKPAFQTTQSGSVCKLCHAKIKQSHGLLSGLLCFSEQSRQCKSQGNHLLK